MIIKKYFIILFLLLLSNFAYPNKIKPKFNLVIDFWLSPIFYESSLDMYGTSFNGSIICGVEIGKFTISGEISENYFSLSKNYYLNQSINAWNILRGTSNLYFRPVKWFELTLGIGGAWFSSSYLYNDTSVIGKDNGGLSFLLNAGFRPWKYFRIKLINRLDLFFDSQAPVPYYYGGIRFDFHPGIDILNIYVEASGMTWLYKDDYVNIQTGMFVWAVGIAFDASFPYEFKKIKKDEIKKDSIIEELKSTSKENIQKLKTAKKDDIIFFPKITFSYNFFKLNEDSYPILDDIAKVLLTRKKIDIEIGVHVYYTGDSLSELKISTKCANLLKSHLISKNINEDRIKIISFWGFNAYYSEFTNEKTFVQIKILPKKTKN